MSGTELRYYQREAIDALYAYFEKKQGNPLIEMPTGSGKSVVISGFLREALSQWPDTRVLAITHVKELIAQNYAAMLRTWADAPAGIYSASLNRRDMGAQILFAGIQSIHTKAYSVQQCDLVLIDEAHLLGKNASGMYRSFLRDLMQINPYLKVIGFTATPYRADQGMLTEGPDRLFTDIAFRVPMLKLIEDGYLCPVIPRATGTMLDVSGVGTRGGDYIPGELAQAVDKDAINAAAVDEIIQAGEGRGSWLVFCASVEHAKHVAAEVSKWNVSAAFVSGETPAPERDRILRDFKNGKIRCLTNMNVLTTGFDAPGVDLIAMLRPTKSVSLYVQMVGRGTRIAPGKDDCIILDFAGNTKRLGTVDDAHRRVRSPGKKEGEGEGRVMAKECKHCKALNALNQRACIACGEEFPPPEGAAQLSSKPVTEALLSTQIKPNWLDVIDVEYSRHEKPGKPPSMRVTYYTGSPADGKGNMAGLRRSGHSEWICFEHTGYPRQKACSWWLQRAPGSAVPMTIEEALARKDELRQPRQIIIKKNGQYEEITAFVFA